MTEEGRPDPDLKILDPVSHKYTGKAFKARYPKLPFAHTPPLTPRASRQ